MSVPTLANFVHSFVSTSYCSEDTMAHWFHRNPLKATVVQTFDTLRAAAKTSDANKLLTWVSFANHVEIKVMEEIDNVGEMLVNVCFRDLKLAREKLLMLLRSPEKSTQEVLAGAEHYFSLLRGLIEPVAAPEPLAESAPAEGSEEAEPAAPAVPSGESKLRKYLVFKWSDTLLGKEARLAVTLRSFLP